MQSKILYLITFKLQKILQ